MLNTARFIYHEELLPDTNKTTPFARRGICNFPSGVTLPEGAKASCSNADSNFVFHPVIASYKAR